MRKSFHVKLQNYFEFLLTNKAGLDNCHESQIYLNFTFSTPFSFRRLKFVICNLNKKSIVYFVV